MNAYQFKHNFEDLYLPLCMFALRLLSDREETEDVVQQAFASTWERFEAGEEIANLKGYLYMIVRNSCISRLRILSRENSLYENLESAEDVCIDEIDTSERDAKLWREIGKLPARCREVFLLSKRDGYTNKEIAEELGISEKTVENQMTKAYSRLREALNPEGRKVFFLPFL